AELPSFPTRRSSDLENDYYHTAACVPCHGEIESWNDFKAAVDFDNDGTVESIPEEIAGLEKLLRIWLPPVGIDSIDYAAITEDRSEEHTSELQSREN